jgi:PAS domain S-box-containing protein
MPDEALYNKSTTDLKPADPEQLFRVTFEQAPIGIAHTGPNREWLRVNDRFCDLLGYTRDELLKLSFTDITHPDDVEKSREIHRQLFYGDHQMLSLEKRFFRKDGSLIWVNVTLAIVRAPDGTGLYSITLVEDITERKQIEITEQQQRTLAEALRDSAVALHSTLDVSQVLDGILACVERVVPHNTSTIMLIQGDEAHVVRTRGIIDQDIAGAVMTQHPLISETPVLKQMVETHQPIIIPDVKTDLRWVHTPHTEWQHSYVGVPILLRSDIIGFLNLNSAAPRFFKPEHVELLQIFAAQAATALQNAQLFEKVQRLAALEERQRLARELHDGVSQSVFSSSIIAEALPRLWRRSPDQALAYLEQLKTLNQSVLAEMRVLLMELRPTQLLTMNLIEQLQQLMQGIKGRKHVDTRLNIGGEYPVPPNVQIALYRIVQEALNNIVKHTHATKVEISYSSSPESVELSIWDNGSGFDPQQAKGGAGVEAMREHAGSIQASLNITSSQQNGTRVSVRWEPDI